MNSKSVKHRALLITYAFPPLQASESFLCVKAFAKIETYDIDILTINPSEIGYDMDYSLENYTSANFSKVYRVETPKWINKKVFKVLRYVPGFPDRFRFFNKSIIEKTKELDIDSYDLIISWSTWHSIHIVASKIKKNYPSVKWLAHLSDPWADNPFLTRYIGYKASQYFLEKKVLSSADSINFTTNRARMLVMKKYPKSWIDKTFVTPHSYDKSLYVANNQKEKKSEQLVISYLGNFYGPRNPINLIKALRIIHNEDNSFFHGVVFRFIGKWIGNDDWKSKIEGLPDDLIDSVASIPYGDSLTEMSKSDLLLILDAPFNSSVFFPSKLVDYIGANKPIFAITPEGSCFDILESIGGLNASPKSVESIKHGIIDAVSKLKKGELSPPSFKKSQRYSNTYVSKEFEILFNLTVGG